ncbi:hypothetical protein KFL_007380045 [Klebsormidium nitens]|uniref:Uncharacterized protein n=1 Tax=Klebsormidium nitens TaxID=105231 RepID=A0A1Y1IK12_KLENI|nr:hypothetical protein KFL_007380045 [Klebsormidium nitens]|eukprot:GAQ91170.1 hypothetical protein KFL_007380045 [Klebsormidium nitens]
MDGILTDIPDYVGDDFHHTQAWHRFFRLIVTPWNSVCQRRSENLTMDVWCGGPNNSIDAQVDAFQLPPGTVAELQACRGERGVRSAIVYLYLRYKEVGKRDRAHATFLLFDLKRRVQWFFDPATKAFDRFYDRPALVPGYTTAPRAQAVWVSNNKAIQHRWPAEGTELDRRKCCQLLCNMVALCCLRFGIVNPRLAANVLADAYPTGKLRRALNDKIASFYNVNYQDTPAEMGTRLLAPIPNARAARAPPPPPPLPPPPGKAGSQRAANMFETNLRARKVAGHNARVLAKVAREYTGSNLSNANILRNYSHKYKWVMDAVALADAERKKLKLPVAVVGQIIPKVNKTKPLTERDLERHLQNIRMTAQTANMMSELRSRLAKRSAV